MILTNSAIVGTFAATRQQVLDMFNFLNMFDVEQHLVNPKVVTAPLEQVNDAIEKLQQGAYRDSCLVITRDM